MRKTSDRRGRQSLRNCRKIRFSPFWLKRRMPESILEDVRGLLRSPSVLILRWVYGKFVGDKEAVREGKERVCWR